MVIQWMKKESYSGRAHEGESLNRSRSQLLLYDNDDDSLRQENGGRDTLCARWISTR